jgi:uncharacterized membrane protein
MRKDISQLIIMTSGAVLIVVGIGLIIPQFYIEMSIYAQIKSIGPSGFDASRGLHISTSYVGVMVLGLGAVLEIIGYISVVPWKENKNSN